MHARFPPAPPSKTASGHLTSSMRLAVPMWRAAKFVPNVSTLIYSANLVRGTGARPSVSSSSGVAMC